MSRSDKKIEPMDASVKEARIGSALPNNARMCWAMKVLINEVNALFPEAAYEVSNYDGRNTAHDVVFDLTMLDSQDASDLATLFKALGDPAMNDDRRIEQVIVEDGQALISFASNPRTQDDRTSFDLAGAHAVLTEDADMTEGYFNALSDGGSW